MSSPIIDAIRKNSPSILAIASIMGMAGGIGYAIKVTPEALNRLDEEEHYRVTPDGHSGPPLTPLEILRLTWDLYIPTGLFFIATTGMIFGINTIQSRRLASLGAAYTFVENAYSNYRRKTIESIGEKSEQEIRDQLAQDALIRHPIEEASVFYTGKGDHLMFDELSGRYFRSDINAVKKAMNDFNKMMLDDMYLPVNDFFYELGLESTVLGERMGYDANNHLLAIDFIPKISTDDQPCIVLHYVTVPHPL